MLVAPVEYPRLSSVGATYSAAPTELSIIFGVSYQHDGPTGLDSPTNTTKILLEFFETH